MITVKLSPREMLFAAYAGVHRQVVRTSKGCNHTGGWKAGKRKDGWTQHVTGSIGELVVAKLLNKFWSGPTDLGAPDVGRPEEGIEVRTVSDARGSLVIRPTDKDTSKFYLVVPTDDPLTFGVAGWFLAGDAKARPELLANPLEGSPAFFVPQSMLHPAVAA